MSWGVHAEFLARNLRPGRDTAILSPLLASEAQIDAALEAAAITPAATPVASPATKAKGVACPG